MIVLNDNYQFIFVFPLIKILSNSKFTNLIYYWYYPANYFIVLNFLLYYSNHVINGL